MHPLRRSEVVIGRLLAAMSETVVTYHPSVKRTGTTIDGLIAGTACFPGGAGLWRGAANGGRLPEYFPQSPVMLVGHNFDSVRGFELSLGRKGEVDGQFWQILLAIVRDSGLAPDQCFYTNALMGLKPGSANGAMQSVRGYKEQCRLFLSRQVEIVVPRAVIALGVNAEEYVSGLDCDWLAVKHPKDWHFRELSTRRERIHSEGKMIREFLYCHSAGVVAETPRIREDQVKTPIVSQHIHAAKGQTLEDPELFLMQSEIDSFGFRLGTRQSFLVKAIEAGNKDKEGMRLDYCRQFNESSNPSNRKSTFDVFFSDFIRPFGSASASRSVRIRTDSQGHLSLDQERSKAIKSAVARGILREVNAVEKGIFPKKNRQAIEAILDRFGVPVRS